MTKDKIDIIVIGGSSGSIAVVSDILNSLPPGFAIPIVIVIHRMKNVKSELKTILSESRIVYEPDDKEPVSEGCIYLAPQNYHLLVEENRTFSLDYSELVHYSRPSIDVTFQGIAGVYRSQALAILLSGANADGADGIAHILQMGGRAIIQDPETAEYEAMPAAAIRKSPSAVILTPALIMDAVLSLTQNDQNDQ